ncbi:DUF4124 domain-containing protein [Lysobacter solisilvae (ex Woo and Kim 2020)]|uniref:DUF4124 domain-containing protein n=1 Tax=Agrilutibacter terrestris TaxID=2865112 RepID=A0A7H0FUU9_9GAMM|nr:DUF4124 domain-containing protein [Lysobacter terrestris]QNP39815.1 DUF4124 domain-containing protein [Lysobacter terrestris]
MPLRPLLPLLLFCALLSLWPRPAQADVRRCVTASGQTIFTDRKCTEVDAVERLPRDDAPAAARVRRAGGCARTLQDLVFEMTSAIDARDANRLAGVYHWPGTSADAGYRIWMRLDAIASRPLVDIVPVMPASNPAPETTTADSDDADGVATSAPPAQADGDLYPQTTVRRNPVALRVEQTVGNSATPSRTVFGLTHYFGCWWLRF